MSNKGGTEIDNKAMEILTANATREDLKLRDFEELVKSLAFNQTGKRNYNPILATSSSEL